jgi:3-hydroxy-9,10-secoandrosta-1,3,5(10)-triene-9,17-dione monooxygenase
MQGAALGGRICMRFAVIDRPSSVPASSLAVPEPGLTPRDLFDRAISVRPMLRERQAEHEELGTYADDVHTTFERMGFYRITQPRMFGGYEFGLPTFFRTMVEVSRGDPGVGWCLTLAASHAFLLASHWPEQAQRELFGETGHFIAPHRAQPLGTATPVPGGYLIKGRWNYSSGVPHATHFIGTALLQKEDGSPPSSVLVVVPRGDYAILKDWGGDEILGMRSSGSNTVVIEDALIPTHHVIPFNAQFCKPEEMVGGTPGTRLHGNPMYLGRIMGPYHASLVSVVVGATWAAIDEYEELICRMKTLADPSLLRADHHDFQRTLGLAIARADAAEAILVRTLERYMELCERWAADGTPISVEDNLRLRATLQQAGAMGAETVEMLLRSAGAFTTKKGDRLQRYFRDVMMYRTHSSAQVEEFATYVGRAHLGRPIGMRGL